MPLGPWERGQVGRRLGGWGTGQKPRSRICFRNSKCGMQMLSKLGGDNVHNRCLATFYRSIADPHALRHNSLRSGWYRQSWRALLIISRWKRGRAAREDTVVGENGDS